MYAEKLIEAYESPYVYIATARVLDAEMADRVAKHRERRADDCETLESPLALVDGLSSLVGRGKPVLVDCLTLWMSNLLLEDSISSPEESVERLCEMLHVVDYPLVLVSNEVGCGVVPDNELGRRFRDLAGWANQRVAMACSGVTWVTAGLPLPLKTESSHAPRRSAAGNV
jgi:adenosylcobinamide kinase/adenosylcobinamide-phosphate guanylyltransferase